MALRSLVVFRSRSCSLLWPGLRLTKIEKIPKGSLTDSGKRLYSMKGISDRQTRGLATANFNHMNGENEFSVKKWGSRLKELSQKYGPIALGFHFGVEAIVFGGFFSLVSSGLIDTDLLLHHFHSATGINVPVPPTASNVLLSYILTTSLTGFPRTVLTVLATPWLARRFGWKR